MSYTKLTDFASKDALLTGNPSKLVRGTELGAEFDAIEVADALNIKPDNVTAATGKTTPVDADLLTLFDSASTFSLKKLTWANIKATVKTYFDTLYARSGANTDITSLGAVASINGGQLAGLRNRIINGGMQVAQRGFVLPIANNLQYAMDRFYGYNQSTAISGGTIGQQSNAGSSTGIFGGYLSFSAVNLTSLAIGQRVESFNSIPLNGKTVTVSAVVYQDTGSALNGYFQLIKPTVLDNYGSKTVIVTQGVVSIPHATPTKVTYTVTFGASDASLGLEVDWNFVTSGNYTGKYFMISDVQLELGSVATPFEQRPYGMELALCQRYYEVSTDFQMYSGYANSGQGYYNAVRYQVTKRAIPSVVTLVDATNSGFPASAPTLSSTSADGFSVVKFANATNAAGYYRYSWTSSAEL